jgi:hypothetical protein
MVFHFHRAVAKPEEEGQSEKGCESDEPAKLENEKRGDNAKDYDQSRIKTEPAHRSAP